MSPLGQKKKLWFIEEKPFHLIFTTYQNYPLTLTLFWLSADDIVLLLFRFKQKWCINLAPEMEKHTLSRLSNIEETVPHHFCWFLTTNLREIGQEITVACRWLWVMSEVMLDLQDFMFWSRLRCQMSFTMAETKIKPTWQLFWMIVRKTLMYITNLVFLTIWTFLSKQWQGKIQTLNYTYWWFIGHLNHMTKTCSAHRLYQNTA